MPIILRPPTHTNLPAPTAGPEPPSLDHLEGTWHVTHSTLPMWKTKSRVRITYTPLPAGATGTARLDDLVEYNAAGKPKSVHGVDKMASEDGPRKQEGWAWHWRGKGLLMVASSRWEILGYGDEPDSGNCWIVTYFAKTLFTPAGIDVYSRDEGGLREETLEEIRSALAGVEDEGTRKLVGDLFEIPKE